VEALKISRMVVVRGRDESTKINHPAETRAAHGPDAKADARLVVFTPCLHRRGKYSTASTKPFDGHS
jgi:hypothetical protein